MKSVTRNQFRARAQARRVAGAFGTCVCLISLALLAACETWRPVRDIPRAPVRTGKDVVTNEDVQLAIKRAAHSLDWDVEDAAAGQIVATKRVKKRMASVSIDYYLSVYSIRYRSSENFSYRLRPTKDLAGTVHDFNSATINIEYNEWIEALDLAIQTELANLK